VRIIEIGGTLVREIGDEQAGAVLLHPDTDMLAAVGHDAQARALSVMESGFKDIAFRGPEIIRTTRRAIVCPGPFGCGAAVSVHGRRKGPRHAFRTPDMVVVIKGPLSVATPRQGVECAGQCEHQADLSWRHFLREFKKGPERVKVLILR